MRFGCASAFSVVKRPKPAIPWHFLIAVVALKIPVVERMIKRPKLQFAFVFDLISKFEVVIVALLIVVVELQVLALTALDVEISM